MVSGNRPASHHAIFFRSRLQRRVSSSYNPDASYKMGPRAMPSQVPTLPTRGIGVIHARGAKKRLGSSLRVLRPKKRLKLIVAQAVSLPGQRFTGDDGTLS